MDVSGDAAAATIMNGRLNYTEDAGKRRHCFAALQYAAAVVSSLMFHMMIFMCWRCAR